MYFDILIFLSSSRLWWQNIFIYFFCLFQMQEDIVKLQVLNLGAKLYIVNSKQVDFFGTRKFLLVGN